MFRLTRIYDKTLSATNAKVGMQKRDRSIVISRHLELLFVEKPLFLPLSRLKALDDQVEMDTILERVEKCDINEALVLEIKVLLWVTFIFEPFDLQNLFCLVDRDGQELTKKLKGTDVAQFYAKLSSRVIKSFSSSSMKAILVAAEIGDLAMRGLDQV